MRDDAVAAWYRARLPPFIDAVRLTSGWPGYYHISSGDLLRAEVAKKTALGASIQARIIEGKLVDDDVILTLIENTMLKSGASTFIIDGFPSRIDQAIKFEERIAKCDFVLYLQASDEVGPLRSSGRADTVDIASQVILSRRRDDRVDDTAETLRKRLTTFHQEVLPTIQHYERFGKVKTVDASRPTDAVFADVRRAVAPNVPGSIEKRSTLDRLRQKSPTGTVYVVFVLGGPGSGKGTQCDMIKAQLGNALNTCVPVVLAGRSDNVVKATSTYRVATCCAPRSLPRRRWACRFSR